MEDFFERIEDPSQIAGAVRKKKVDDTVKITVNRYGRQFEVGVQVDELP